jgi:hypothetical protein
METESLSSHQPTFGIKLVFILFGIASLLGCNALLTELSFFDHFLHSMNPFVSFPFLNYFLNVAFQIIIFAKKDLFPLKFQLIGGLVGSIFFLVVIPLFTIILEKDSSINKIVTGAFIVLMGFINALCNAGFYGLVSFFPMELIVSLSTGQGLSGISMALIQYIVLLTIESDGKDDKPIIIQGLVFFISSIIILLISLVILLISYNKEFFQYYLNKKDDKPGASSEIEMNESLGSITEQRVNSSDKIQTKGELTFGQIFRKIWSFDLLVFLNYLVTFAVYPGASINQKLFSLTGAFNSNTVIMIYNVFDTLGRMLVSKMKPTKQLNMIIILARTVLLFTIVFNYYCQDKLEWNIVTTSILLIINVSILAATNGIATTLCFGLAPNEVENEYKGQAGSSVSLFLIVGIVGGSSLAFLVDLIIGKFKKQPVTE